MQQLNFWAIVVRGPFPIGLSSPGKKDKLLVCTRYELLECSGSMLGAVIQATRRKNFEDGLRMKNLFEVKIGLQ